MFWKLIKILKVCQNFENWSDFVSSYRSFCVFGIFCHILKRSGKGTAQNSTHREEHCSGKIILVNFDQFKHNQFLYSTQLPPIVDANIVFSNSNSNSNLFHTQTACIYSNHTEDPGWYCPIWIEPIQTLTTYSNGASTNVALLPPIRDHFQENLVLTLPIL